MRYWRTATVQKEGAALNYSTAMKNFGARRFVSDAGLRSVGLMLGLQAIELFNHGVHGR